MAKLVTAAPEVIGRVRGASRNVRYLKSGRGEEWMEAGRQFGRAAGGALSVAADWTDERHRAGFVKSYADAEAEAERRYQEEVQNRIGFDAEGAEQRARQIYAEVGAKYRAQIGGNRYQERFDLAWSRLSNGQSLKALSFEQRNLKAASIDTDKALINRSIEGVASSMEPEIQNSRFRDLQENYDRLYLTQNGGKRLPAEVLAEFDADVEKGFVKTRTGKIRVTEGEEGEGTISKAKVAKLRSRWEDRSKAYRQGLEKLCDQAHANVVSRLLKDDRVYEADRYLGRLEDDGIPVTGRTKTLLSKAVQEKMDVLSAKEEAELAIGLVRNEAEYPQYNSKEQNAAFAKRFSDLPEKAKPYALQKWKELKAERDANLQLALYEFSVNNLQTAGADGNPVALPLSEQEAKINAITDPVLKASLKEIHRRKVIAQENEANASPEYVVYADGALSQFTRDLARGFAEADGNRVDLSTKPQQMMYLRSLGLTRKYRDKALEYIKDSGNMVNATEVETVLVKAFSGAGKTREEVASYVPFIQRLVEDRRGTMPLGGKADRARWIKEQVEDVLTTELEKKREFIWDKKTTLKTAIEEGDDTGLLYLDSSNMEKLRRRQTSVWEARGADTSRRRERLYQEDPGTLKRMGLRIGGNKYHILKKGNE